MENEHKVRWFDVISLVLAIIALVVAFVHLIELDHTVDRIEKVQEGLSTRYIGEYPMFFPRLVKVVSTAQRNLVIAADLPAYGDMSQHATAEEYYFHIKKRRPRVNVEAMFLDLPHRQRLLDDLFSVRDWQNWRADATKKGMVENFLKLHAKNPGATQSRVDLLRVVSEINNEIVRDVFLNSAMVATTDMPMYFWIADCQEAVFAIANLHDGTEHGFYTSDKSLIKGLLNIRTRYNPDPAVVANLSKPCD